ncbi:MAG: hypothetical protein A2Y41_14010 [Spirochaetes bacterium GWB1_36_13]|nr:MAG: hypothetical protein A2Y41_14010 [Spirochaetes bacterium GWB1_36_13]
MMKSVSKNEITAFVHNFPNAMFFLSRFEMYRKFKPIRLFEPKEISSGNKNEDQKFVFYSDNELTEIEEKNIQEKNSSFYSIPVLIGLSVFIIWLVLRRKKRKVKILKIPSERWSLLFHQGENDQLEFKASLRWDYKNSQINKILEYTVAKTLCAFLNSSGGMLFIGISDSKDVLGLEEDYQTLGKHHQSRDGFILRLTSIINEYLGKEVHRFISIQVEEIEGKDIALIQLSPSSHPVFLMLKDREEFFIRTAASSQSMGLRESHNYIRMKWG